MDMKMKKTTLAIFLAAALLGGCSSEPYRVKLKYTK
jgi:PBP1b-binding outer membrane lipoprotein LpoB